MRELQSISRDHREDLAAFIQSMRHSTSWKSHPYSIRYLRTAKHRLLRIVASIPSAPHHLRILDIGTTPLTFFIRQQFPQHVISTVDLTPLWRDHSQANQIQFHACDLVAQELPHSDKTFDIVIFTEVLEHLDAPPTLILKKIQRVLKPGGTLIFSVPNFTCLRNRILILCGRNPLAMWHETPMSVHGYGHLREYTRHEVIQLLTTCAFQITSLNYIQPQVFDAFTRTDLTFFKKLITATYYIVSSYPSLRQFIFVKCKKSDE